MVTRVRIYGDSLAEGRGRGNPLTVDPKGAIVYTIGYGLGLTDSQIVNYGVGGSGIADALARQRQTPAGGPGSLDILWTGHNDVRPVPYPYIVQSIKDGYQDFYTYARSNGGSALMLGMTSGFGTAETSELYAVLQDINAYIAAAFPVGDRFISYEYLCRQIGPDSSATCQAMIDAGLTPTATDRSDIISGWTPDSIRADAGVGHINQIGQDTYGDRLVRHINSTPPPPPPPPPSTGVRPVSHNYASSGDYTVKLTVTDDDGRTGTVSRIVSVASPVVVDPGSGTTLVLKDDFLNAANSQDLAPAAGLTTAAPFRFIGPNNTYGWRNVHRPSNQGDAGIVVGGTRAGILLPKRVENRSASGASYIGVNIGKIPTRWEIDFAFDPGAVGPWKMGFHFWDSLSDVGETVPGHFSCRFRGWGFDAGNVSGAGPALTPFGSNRDGLGDSTGSQGQWPNGDLDPYDGTSRTIYTLIIEHVGGNTLRFTFPPQTGAAPVTITDNRLEEITAKGVCVCLWESFRSLSTDSRDFMTGMRFQVGQAGVAGTPAKRAHDVYTAYGINTHFTYLGADSEWAQTSAAVSWLQTLGVGAIRQILARSTAGRNAIKTAAASLGSGVKWLMPLLTVEETTTLAAARTVVNEQLDWLVANFTLSRIRGFPGCNEPNGGDTANAPLDWENKTRWAQQAIYEEVRKRPAFNHVQIQGPPLNMKGGATQVPQETAAIGDLSAWLDWGDVHVYSADDDPEFGLDTKLSWVEPMHPGKPIAVTEGGYSTSIDRGYTGGSKLVAETQAGQYGPKNLMVHAVAGRQWYSYELLDGAPPFTDTVRSVREGGFGLVRVPSLTASAWTAKPGFDAMRRILALFKDPTPHTPTGLVVDVTGPSDLRQGLYKKSNGNWLLAVWRAVDLYSWNNNTTPQTGTVLAVTSRTVTVTFGQTRPVQVYEPSVQDAATRNITVSSFTINLGAGLQVCEIGPVPGTSSVSADVASDADWILTAQLLDGGIAQYPDKTYMVPYFSNLAALGLARAAEVTGNPKYTDACWRWLDWYVAHMDSNGFVTDYSIAPNQALTSTGDMDSTDSYAATFLMAAHKTWTVTGNTTRLATLSAGITKAVDAIKATQEPDGLTWAKPSYHVKYLMDNSEAWAGLQAAYAMAGALGNTTLQSSALAASRAIATGLETMWNATNQSYNWAKFESGAQSASNWSVGYPDAHAQAFSVAFGLVRGTRATDLVNKFNIEQPLWDQPAATHNGVLVSYWPPSGWAFIRVGQTTRSQAGAASIRAAAITANRAWPYHVGVAGGLITLESTDPSYLAPLVT